MSMEHDKREILESCRRTMELVTDFCQKYGDQSDSHSLSEDHDNLPNFADFQESVRRGNAKADFPIGTELDDVTIFGGRTVQDPLVVVDYFDLNVGGIGAVLLRKYVTPAVFTSSEALKWLRSDKANYDIYAKGYLIGEQLYSIKKPLGGYLYHCSKTTLNNISSRGFFIPSPQNMGFEDEVLSQSGTKNEHVWEYFKRSDTVSSEVVNQRRIGYSWGMEGPVGQYYLQTYRELTEASLEFAVCNNGGLDYCLIDCGVRPACYVY